MYKKNIIEPLAAKEQILKSATETTTILLGIDDILATAAGASASAGRPGS